MPIEKLHARQIFDSRGHPTTEFEVTAQKGAYTCELRDGSSDRAQYPGNSV